MLFLLLQGEADVLDTRQTPVHALHCMRKLMVLLSSTDIVAIYPSKFFLTLQSFCCRLSVVLLSYDSRSALIRLDRRNNLVETDGQTDSADILDQSGRTALWLTLLKLLTTAAENYLSLVSIMNNAAAG